MYKNNYSWQQLNKHSEFIKPLHLRELFQKYRQNYQQNFCLQHNGLILDFGKQRITAKTLQLLRNFADQMQIQTWIQKMLNGEKINHTEHRAVGHIKLRAGNNAPPEVKNVLRRMENFADQIHNSTWKGHSGKAIKNIVSLGIGGSDLGTRMVVIALSALHLPQVKLHFVSNVDSADLVKKLTSLNPETTLFIVESKTFTTQETMRNAESAKAWILNFFHEKSKNFSGNLVENENENEIVKKHFVAVSTNIEATQKFGIPPENVFEFWDWVGGRFSLWSAIGLPILLAVGKKHFADFLAGANDMDEHFIHSDLDKNLPLTLALLSVWNTNFLNAPSFAVFPYSQSLTRFPRYLQQLEMESNGKTVDRNAQIVDFATSPIVWGTAGTNGQHSYFQLLHQGGQIVASDFICVKKSDFPEFITDSKNKNSQHLQQHQNILLANCLAQSAALAFGQTADEAKKYGISDDLLAYRTFKGNQPSTTLILPELTPFVLGQLLALYEHKVFCLGVLWNLNSFDQWGVELGKHLAGKILPFFKDKNNTKNDEVFNNLDSSTQLLLDSLLKC